MSSLLDVTVGSDVATITDESKLPEVKLMQPLELYRLWERQNWSSHQVDLEQDRRDWESMPDALRDEMSWGLAAFFVGEERVTNQFSGLVLAAEDKHEEAFLITQQVDEARHAQHFNRLYEEVFGVDGSFEDRLQRACQDLTADYFTLFDEYLVDAHQALLSDPSSVEAKVDFVAIYHMVIEGMLALTGQYFQTDNLERRGILPGHLKAFGLTHATSIATSPTGPGTCRSSRAIRTARGEWHERPAIRTEHAEGIRDADHVAGLGWSGNRARRRDARRRPTARPESCLLPSGPADHMG